MPKKTVTQKSLTKPNQVKEKQKSKHIEYEIDNNEDKLSNNCFNDFIKKLRSPRYKPFTKEEEYYYISSFKNGKLEYRAKIIEKNLPLVVKIALKARNRGVPVEDLINEGCIGLNTALEKFDISKGFRFSTYAVSWIYKYVNMCVVNGRNSLKIPMTTQSNITKVLNVFNSDENDITATNYTLSALSKKIGLSEKVIDTIISSLNLYSVENLEDLLTKDYSEGTNISTLNYVEPSISNKNYELEAIDEKVYITKQEIKNLPKEELQLLEDFYGLNGTEVVSLKEIALKNNISYNKIRNKINLTVANLSETILDRLELNKHNARTVAKYYLTKNNLPLRLVDYYVEKFWIPCSCSLLPINLASAHFLVAIRYGVNTAIRILQKATKSPQDIFLSEETINKVSEIGEAIILENYKKIVQKHIKRMKYTL